MRHRCNTMCVFITSVGDDELIELPRELFMVAAVFEAGTDISFGSRN